EARRHRAVVTVAAEIPVGRLVVQRVEAAREIVAEAERVTDLVGRDGFEDRMTEHRADHLVVEVTGRVGEVVRLSVPLDGAVARGGSRLDLTREAGEAVLGEL